jgi:16S rRNA G966 N2-methylase RsmD
VVALTSTEFSVQGNIGATFFRPIYYLGCKTSFTSAIKTAIDEVDPSGGRLVDLFSGTGVVAGAMGASRNVTTVDIQEYSRVLCSAMLNPVGFSPGLIEQTLSQLSCGEAARQVIWCSQPVINYEQNCIDEASKGNVLALIAFMESPPLVAYESQEYPLPDSRLGEAVQETIARLSTLGLSRSPDTIVTRNFGGVYFSFQQAAMLDAALSIANGAEERVRDTLKAAALSTASLLVNTVGKQFAQPIQPRNRSGVVKQGLAKTVQRDRSLDALQTYQAWLTKYLELPKATGKPQTLRMDYLQALDTYGSTFSVVYADPPYTRDHYSRFYHVLETMCLRDNPPISRVMKDGNFTLSRGVYREDRHQSAFCIRSAAPAAFDALFNAARKHNLPLILSYSPHESGDGTHPRVVSMDQIIEFANKYYNRVKVCAVDGVTHNQLNRNGLKLKTREQAEVILKCFC